MGDLATFIAKARRRGDAETQRMFDIGEPGGAIFVHRVNGEVSNHYED